MSAATAKTQDPSMEEILASIRRIIADDGDAPKQAAPPASRAPARADENDDDVLDLAEIPDAKRAGADLEIEAPDLSFQDAPEPPAPEPLHPEPPEPALEALPEPVEPPPPPPAPPVLQIAPEPAPSTAERLISREATESVNHAFNLLSHTILTQNARTLEDLVGDMLKPMLKVWLDDNLPPLVERLVRAEIERVARGHR